MLFPLDALFLLAPFHLLALSFVLVSSPAYGHRFMLLSWYSPVPLLLVLLAVLAAVIGLVPMTHDTEHALRIVHIFLDATLGISISQLQFLLASGAQWRACLLLPLTIVS